jgi:cell division protein FtsL
MNAAARVIHQSNVFSGHWLAIRMSKGQGLLLTLAASLLLTAIAIIYVTNESRFALSELERMEKQTHELRMEWGQLLLEQASLSSPSRIEQLASQKMGMHLPAEQSVEVLRVE